MTDREWLIEVLLTLRARFREARLTYPGLISRLVRFSSDDLYMEIEEWHRIRSFAAIHEEECELTSKSILAVDSFFLRPAETSLERASGAWWDLRTAVRCFGQLAAAAAFTLHVDPIWQGIAKRFWWEPDERAWIGLLHYQLGKPGPNENAVEMELWGKTVLKRKLIRGTEIIDVFEASCRLIDQIANGVETVTVDANGTTLSIIPKGDVESPLTVSLNPPTVKLRDTIHVVTPDGAILVQALVEAAGDWLAGSKLEMRADRAKKSLPEPLQDLIESSPGKGYRLRRIL